MKPGDVVNFSIKKDGVRNHICKVEVFRGELTLDNREFYLCRRLDNGQLVVAWSEDLTGSNSNAKA